MFLAVLRAFANVNPSKALFVATRSLPTCIPCAKNLICIPVTLRCLRSMQVCITERKTSEHSLIPVILGANRSLPAPRSRMLGSDASCSVPASRQSERSRLCSIPPQIVKKQSASSTMGDAQNEHRDPRGHGAKRKATENAVAAGTPSALALLPTQHPPPPILSPRSSFQIAAGRDHSKPASLASKVAIPRLPRLSGTTSPIGSIKTGDKHRVTHACEPCRHRKTKCSGERPSCKHCDDFKIACTYADGKRDRVKKYGLNSTSRRQPSRTDSHQGIPPYDGQARSTREITCGH